MRWLSFGVRVDKLVRVFSAIASVVCLTISLLFVFVSVIPLYYFRGYVNGYFSLIDYRLFYSHTQQQVHMPHTSYVRHVTVVFFLLSIASFMISVVSLIVLRKKSYLASGLIYGVSSGLVILFGLLYGYIYRAVSLDISRFNIFLGDEISFTSYLGVTRVEGIKIERLLLHELVFGTPLVLLLLVVAVTLSAISVGVSLYRIYEVCERESRWCLHTPRKVVTYGVLFMTTVSVMASTFVYYPSSLSVLPQSPPVRISLSPYMYVCTGLTRTTRAALTYTDFEYYPLSGWTSSGGVWSSVGNVSGAKGNVLSGTDNNNGVGEESLYYYNTDLSSRTSLWVLTKTKWVSGSTNQYYGVALMNNRRNSLVTVEIFTDGVSGYFDIWSYNVATRNGWQRHARVQISNYDRTKWYVIVVSYSVSGNTISISSYLYDVSGNYITSVSASISGAFRPSFIGVSVDYTGAGGSLTAYFDDFMISSADPRNAYFAGLQSGMIVDVFDNLGGLVSSGVSSGNTLSLSLVHDAVVGTGVDGKIVMKYPDGHLCGILTVPPTDVVLGGDAYSVVIGSMNVVLGANRTSSTVFTSVSGYSYFTTVVRVLKLESSQPLYVRIVLTSANYSGTLNADMWLEGVVKSTNITIRNSIVTSTSTNVVQLRPDGNNYVVFSGHFMSPSQTATLILRIEVCTSPEFGGVCVFYPTTIELSSS